MFSEGFGQGKPEPTKVKFARDKVHIFQTNVLLSEKFQPLRDLVNKPEIGKPDLDLCVLKMNDLIIDAARKTCPVSTKARGRNPRRKKRWFNKECSALKRLQRR